MSEPLDRNKTELTHKLTALASGYLDLIGCEPIETEVQIRNCWIADVAGFTYPTLTEMRKGKLLKRILEENVDLQKNVDMPGYIFKEREWEYAQFFKWRNYHPFTVLCEVKVSESDFKKDLPTKFSFPCANLNYVVVPQKLSDTVISYFKRGGNLNNWGILICSQNGEKIMKIYGAYIVPQLAQDTIDFIAQIAIRRAHRTRYAYMRSMLKAYRANRAKG